MPLSQERELEIERELAIIMRQLDRLWPVEKPATSNSEQAVQPARVPPLLLDE